MRKNLSESEYQELLALEYVLTWMYTHEYEKDNARYMELAHKNYN